MTREEFVSGFAMVWTMRHDLPDVMLEEVKEIKDEFKSMEPDEDFSYLAEWVNELLNNEGFPSLFRTDEEH